MGKSAKHAVKRKGLRPLPVHVAAVLAAQAKDPQHYSPAAMEAMIAGIKAYQNNPFCRRAEKLKTVWREGEANLLFCPAVKKPKNKSAVLLVPSMINRSAIMDLMPGRSFLRWLAKRGIDVYLLDWGEPVRDPGQRDLNAVIRERLVPAMEFLHKKNRRPFCAVGYCMGGTLLAGAALLAPECLSGAVFLASPWDFHAGDRTLANFVKMGTASALQMTEDNRPLPADWIQSIFAAVSADRTAQKFADFLKLEPGGAKARLFVAAEDWLNDGVDFPPALAQECVLGWYGRNLPGKGQWKLGRKTVNSAKIRTRALVVASASDRLVPMESSLALAKLLPRCEVMKPAIGHIGMMTGRNAEALVWRPVAEWVEELSSPPSEALHGRTPSGDPA